MTTPLRVGVEGRDDSGRAFDSLRRNIAEVSKGTKEWIKTLSHLSQLTRNVFAGFKTMVSGVEAVLAPSQKLVNLEVQLAASLAKSGQLTDENYKSLLRFASARQDVTLFSREITLRMATIGAEFGLTTEQIGKSIEAVQDRSVQLGRDPIELFRGYAKALSGIGNEWTELGLNVDRNADRNTKFLQTIQQMRSGISEAIADLPTNAFERLGMRIVGIADGLGRVIASTRTFQTIMGVLESWGRSLRDALGDPAAILKIAFVIDQVVQRIVQALAYGASVIVRVAATTVGAIEDIREALLTFLNAGEIAKLSAEYQKLWAASAMPRSAEVRDKLAGLMAKMELLSGTSSGLGRELAKTADELQRFSEKASIFSGPAASLAATMNAIVQSFKAMPTQVWDNQAASLEALVKQAEEDRARLLEENRAWGEDMAATFSTGFQRAFDRDVGMRESFRLLGDDIMRTFVRQFSDAAFDPVKESFGQLAKALAAPFQLVGRVINAVLSPLTNLIDRVVGYIVEQMAVMLGVQTTTAAAGAGIMKALSVEIAASAAGWGAAAVAASIATMGGALATVPEAMAAITSGAALTSALAVPKAAAGAFVEPRPGGTLVRVAEAGQAEVIAPMPKLEAAVGRAMRMYGGGGGGLAINLNGPMEFGGERAADALANKLAGHLALISARDRSYRGGAF